MLKFKRILIALILIIGLIILLNINIVKKVYKNVSEKIKFDFKLNETMEYGKLDDSIDAIGDVVYEEKLNLDIVFDLIKDNYVLTVKINDNEFYNEKLKEHNIIDVTLNEGKNVLIFDVYEDSKLMYEVNKEVYYVKSYVSQFAEKISNAGITVQYINGTREKYEKSKNQLISLGAMNIKGEVCLGDYSKINNNYIWINELTKRRNLILLLNINPFRINSNDNISKTENFVKRINDDYGLKTFEVLNEVNFRYKTDEDIRWYKICMNKLIYDFPSMNFLTSTNANSYNDKNKISSIEFYDRYNSDLENRILYYNIHPYSFKSDEELKNKIKEHKDLISKNGGFAYLNATEYGITTYLTTEDEQAKILVKQTVTLEKDVKYKILYDLWSAEKEGEYDNFGLLTNDYKPRPAYYSMKKYYENTNGAEYIGSIPSVADELEFHVYDKDGVPLVVCWSTDNSKTIEIPYSGFTACDLYGNEIENTDGKLSITNSPVYLKNADRSYFYRAISNTAVNAYDDFLTNYSEYLDSSDEMIAVKNEVNKMEKYAAGLATNGEVTEEEALNKMKEHFAIGNMIIDAYKDGKLSCEYVKLSSMLDQLNTTAYAFEDLVTITAKNVSNAKLEATESIMNSFDNVVSANSEVEMVYPNKIKAFAKDYYDTSSYINGLEEENPIKNGLIISKGLHAYYLAEWANSFADCYLQDYEVKIKYSTTDLTNGDVVATLETDAPIELEGSNQYTFTENGSFTFNYTLNGEEKEITAVVDWIDKDVPVISGIDEREDDMDQVTLNVTDANLDSISLKKDGQDVSFNNGDVLIEVGEYVVIATDLAGNKAERAFKIVDYIESNKTYYISLNGTGDGLSDENPMNVKDVNKTRFYSGDRILFKSGEKYSIDIDCIRKGLPDNRVVISNYGDGELPIINGSISLMSNVDISNLKFTNGAESCLVTNYDFCENVKIENCIFDDVHDTAIYLNRQVSNIEITNCIFKNCKSVAIVMKNDSTGFEADKVSINNNVFIDIAKSIEIGSENLDNVFSEIEISKNYFVGQTGSEAIININKIVPDKFEVYIYSNLFYGFDNAYKVITEDENIKKFLVCDYNAFYRYSESNIFNDIKNIADLINRYDNENGSKVVFISKEKYEVEKCLESVSALNSVDKIVEFLSTDVKAHEGEKQLRSYGRTDELIINKVLTADEMKKLNMKVMTDSTVADEKLPLAGWQKVSIAGILIIAVTGLFSAIKYAKFKKDTRKQIRRK